MCLLTPKGLVLLEVVSADELNRRRPALLGLSRAFPDLRLELHHVMARGGRIICWHAEHVPTLCVNDPLDPNWAICAPYSDSDAEEDSEEDSDAEFMPQLAVAFEQLEQYDLDYERLDDEVKKSLLDLGDEKAAACLRACFDTLQNVVVESPIDWIKERIAAVAAEVTPETDDGAAAETSDSAPAGAPALPHLD